MIIESIKIIKEFYGEISKNKEIKQALKDNLYRELRYNIAISDEIEKSKNKENLTKFILLFKTDFYSTLKSNLIDIKKFIDDTKVFINSNLVKNKNFIRYSQNINTKVDLIERIYLKFLMLILKKELCDE